ncbi:MAG: hypothetical protein KIS78_32555 [Labilithrix sp.]|nr:hypothetical protein [Labilithrix sp.]MCW5837171.1 hypothetical protein [Labilithrix sp.]
MLKVHETTRPDGALAPVFVFVEDGALGITSEAGTFALPDGALDAVMARYGKPLETSERLTSVGALDLGDGRVLRHVRHLARYDVIARDFLVYEVAGAEPLCALATTVAGALDHLGRAASAR